MMLVLWGNRGLQQMLEEGTRLERCEGSTGTWEAPLGGSIIVTMGDSPPEAIEQDLSGVPHQLVNVEPAS